MAGRWAGGHWGHTCSLVVNRDVILDIALLNSPLLAAGAESVGSTANAIAWLALALSDIVIRLSVA